MFLQRVFSCLPLKIISFSYLQRKFYCRNLFYTKSFFYKEKAGSSFPILLSGMKKSH